MVFNECPLCETALLDSDKGIEETGDDEITYELFCPICTAKVTIIATYTIKCIHIERDENKKERT